MSFMLKISLAVSLLLAADGMVCLLFRKKVESWFKNILPGVNLLLLAYIELIGGLGCTALILAFT